MKTFDTLILGLENTEYISIPSTLIEGMTLDNIQETIVKYASSNKLLTIRKASSVIIVLSREFMELTESAISSPFGSFMTGLTPIERLQTVNDIVSISLVNEGELVEDHIYVPWRGSQYVNELQDVVIDEKEIIITVGEDYED